MDCDVLERYLDLYLDGELAMEERAEVEAHLRSCETCRLAAARETRLRSMVRDSVLSVKAPRRLHEQVQRRLRDRAALGERRLGAVVTFAAAAAVVAFAAYGYLALMPQGDPLEEAVAAHEAAAGSEVYGDVERVTAFLREHAPFSFRLPIQEREGLRLVGARVTRLGSTPAILYQYDMGGRRLSVAQFPAASQDAPKGVHTDRRRGYTVATWRELGLEQAVVGDASEQDVVRVIPAAWGPR